MPLRKISWIGLLALVLAGCGAAARAGDPAGDPATAKLSVVTTVAPITNIVYNIGGERIALTGIVPEGVNSHTFEPVPSDAVLLARADLIVMNGLNLEEPTHRLAAANKQESARIVLLGDLAITPAEYVYDFSFPRDGGSPNPHLWTSPRHAKRYAELIRDALVERDPAGRSYYEANLASYSARLDELDAAIARTIASIPPENRKLLTYHDSWAYFAPLYGMEVVGAIQPADFSEPSAREVAALIGQVRQANVPAIFGSEVFPSPVLERIGQEAGVKYVDTLRDDDLPGNPGEPRHSYLGLMVEDVRIMAENLGGDPGLIADFDPSNVPGIDGAVKQAQ